MPRAQRVQAILDELSRHGTLQVTGLSERLGVSEATLRRDLGLLADQDLLTRTHGGALATDAGYDLPVRRARTDEAAVTKALARLAAQRLPAGPHVVAFTGGAAPTEVARRLATRPDLTVVTPALNIAMDALNRPRTKLIMIGGVSRPGSSELAGPWAEDMIASLNVGTLFTGADGISAGGGLTTHDEAQARVTAALIGRAQRVVVVAEGSAVGSAALTRVAAASAIDELITDASAPGPALAALREAGVAIGLVDPGR
jgi:DeoR family transcriptional regulator, aga operon transcriptional repressor